MGMPRMPPNLAMLVIEKHQSNGGCPNSESQGETHDKPEGHLVMMKQSGPDLDCGEEQQHTATMCQQDTNGKGADVRVRDNDGPYDARDGAQEIERQGLRPPQSPHLRVDEDPEFRNLSSEFMSNGPTHHGPAHAGSTGLECHSNKNAIHDITESIPNHDGQHHGIQWAAPEESPNKPYWFRVGDHGVQLVWIRYCIRTLDCGGGYVGRAKVPIRVERFVRWGIPKPVAV
mmetsp:Transcript_94217/g.162928  ORF Transcript_94217/g.162928 Transcript_94217/m.162928 type:complete len:230 (+) Transcript_94217:73-762(+)